MLDGEILAHSADARVDAAGVVDLVPHPDLFVQLGQRVDLGHRSQPVAAKPAHLTFHAALLMGDSDTGLAVERIEPIVRAEQLPAFVLHPITHAVAIDHQRHRRGEIDVSDVAGRNTADLGERLDVAFEERFLPLGGRRGKSLCPSGTFAGICPVTTNPASPQMGPQQTALPGPLQPVIATGDSVLLTYSGIDPI